MSHDVFINHSTAGKLTAYAICSELESVGIRCWILPRDLNVGIGWDQSITNAVACSQVMIVVLTDYASRSDRVDRQLELAFNHGVIVVPFRTESNPIVCQPPASPELVHWLEAVTPEIAQRLSSLCQLVRGLIRRPSDDPLNIGALHPGQEEVPRLNIERIVGLPQPAGTPIEVVPSRISVGQEALDPESANNAQPTLSDLDQAESPPKGTDFKLRKKPAKSLAINALLLVLLPFVIICGIGIWQTKKGPKSSTAKPASEATPSIAPPTAEKVQHQEKFSASNPGWGALDANWSVANGKLRVTPLLNSSAVLINHDRGFADAEISGEVLMSKGDDLNQLGGIIFWAKDYNDCYAFVISADGKFAVGRKLIGRWINPIAKTGNTSIKTGIGESNKLRVRTEGNLLTAFINDIQVATLAGEPPTGLSFIGLYGESAETTQNVWEFSSVTVTSVR
jgi:TIR domain